MPLAATPPTPPAPPARILAFADEFRFNLSRLRVPSGRLILQLKNIGEDDHDFRIIGPKGAVRGTTGVVGPDGLGVIRTRLGRGRYTYLCTVADHSTRGMKGTFTVTRRPPARAR